ncbi:MAG: hypothetical protein HC769_22005 [Cyanobacteria bacterium CRU_2_1]|nr:hypothetical protein [Cyanobacteria bacterium RU_5_0]NJR61267.1 hypothetical protein [Cyanobacteria bacterium CRU_2_1]
MQADGTYEQVEESIALLGLPIALLEEALGQLSEGTNINVALWFSQQIANLETAQS